MKIALTEMNISWQDRRSNLAICQALVSQAARNHADVVVFPEMCLTGFSMDTAKIAEGEDGESHRFLSELAARYRIHVIYGDSIREQDGCFNTLFVLDRAGNLTYRYQKIHPFSFSGEDRHYAAGSRAGVFEIEGISFGAAICYDLRFPEMFTSLAQDCAAFFVIASWPAARDEHWRLLARARALDSLAVILAVNRIGEGDGLQYAPGSMVVNPWAEKQEPTGTENWQDVSTGKTHRLLFWDVDFAQTQQVRDRFSVLRDRRSFETSGPAHGSRRGVP